ncbi:MAG: filamentous hemagglutinin N-terminal domain-containing protein [Pseudomonadota bacterium]
MIIQKFSKRRAARHFPGFKHSLIFLASVTMMNTALANPQGGVVTTGSATIANSGKSTVIQQNSQQAIIQWNSFNIQSGEKTQFVQPNSSAVALNRINPMQGASQINGQLTSNGQIILVNAAGLHFGSGAVVNVGGLIASTSDIKDANFLAAKYIFDQTSTYRNATVTNQGTIVAANYGLVALLGNSVINNGLIKAEMGSVVLGSGAKFTLDFNGDQLINFTVDAPSTAGSITNTGSLIADGGQILVTAQTASSVLDNVIDMAGTAQANSVSQQNGEIILTSNAGVNVTGKMTATGTSADNSGGTIQISANHLTTSHAAFNTSSNTGGGNITFNANSISLVNSSVNANALGSGTGGTIAFNAPSTTFANSLVSAAGVGTGTFGGTINVASNSIYISYGTLLTANGDEIGGNVTLSGVPVAGSQTNASAITLDSWSAISANASGADGIVGGNINLYANTSLLAGNISANDGSTNGVGGDIGVFGQNLYVLPGAFIDASAAFVGGVITLGGNPFSTTASTTSANVILSPLSYVGASVTGSNGFGGVISVSGDNVSLGGELDVSGNPFPYLTFTSTGNSGSYGFCGGGGFHSTPTINNSGSSGGNITVTGNNITVQPGAYLNAAGNLFGGSIELGNSTFSPTASNSVVVNFGSVLDAGSYGTTGNPIGGLIKLYANNTTVNGALNVSGAANSGSLAGEVEIFANNTVTIGSFATILANGDTDGGEVLIGGDLNGAGFDPTAQNTNVAALSYISASALTNGTGGQVVLWSSNETTFSGSIIARGGANSGDGGNVEIGSAQTLNYTKSAYVDVRAPHGNPGTVTLVGTPGPTPASNPFLTLFGFR